MKSVFIGKLRIIVFILLFCIALYNVNAQVVTTVIFDHPNLDDALGWSYNVENEDVEDPNKIYLNLYEIHRQGIHVEMNNAGTADWHTEVRYQCLTLKKDVEYIFTAEISSVRETSVKIGLERQAAPYDGAGGAAFDLSVGENTIEFRCTPDKDYYGMKLCLKFDGTSIAESIPNMLWIHSAKLIGKAPADVEVPVPNYLDNGEERGVKVNHLGYLPESKKIAYYYSSSPDEVEWILFNNDNEEVMRGISKEITGPFGKTIPGRNTYDHIIDFSEVTEAGVYYIKLADHDSGSYYFGIGDNVYSYMSDNALKYFYYNRSGIDIELGNSDYHRPAGHIDDNDISYNRDLRNIDLSGGWYDAGDFGKYTVTGAYSVWTLLNLYEMYGYEVNGLIPEDVVEENGINDLLDESRYELEFLLKMQVPESGVDGNGKYAGTVFHKMHDDLWTGIPDLPYTPEDGMWHQSRSRIIIKPTVAATCDFAAVMAQASRIWRDLDENNTGEDDEFAETCLNAAIKAYDAVFEDDFINENWDTTRKIDNGGGGPYNDDDTTDERYWAAIELYITTGDETYVTDSRFTELNVDTEGDYYGFKEIHVGDEDREEALPHSWDNVSGCGVFSLYAARDKVDNPEMIEKIRNSIIRLAWFVHNNCVTNNAFGIPVRKNEELGWASNHTIINRAMLLAYRYSITDDEKYLEGVTRTMDYLLGTNPLDLSYITGFGERSPKNVHHRLWAGTFIPEFPVAPRGCLAGGPNKNHLGLHDVNVKNHDPFVLLANLHNESVTEAYVDSYESYSTNEVTINWNASLVWISEYVSKLDVFKNGGKVPGKVKKRKYEESVDENEPLKITVEELNEIIDHIDDVIFKIEMDPAKGTVNAELPDVIYIPNPGETGEDIFTFTIEYLGDVSEEIEVKVNIGGLADNEFIWEPDGKYTLDNDMDNIKVLEVITGWGGYIHFQYLNPETLMPMTYGGQQNSVPPLIITVNGIEYDFDQGSWYPTFWGGQLYLEPNSSYNILIKKSDQYDAAALKIQTW